MERAVFNKVFTAIVETYHLDLNVLAEHIGRDPSRIRHWKKDSMPSKKHSDLVILALSEMIQEKRNPYRDREICLQIKNVLINCTNMHPEIMSGLTFEYDMENCALTVLRRILDSVKASPVSKSQNHVGNLPKSPRSYLALLIHEAESDLFHKRYLDAYRILQTCQKDPSIKYFPDLNRHLCHLLGLYWLYTGLLMGVSDDLSLAEEYLLNVVEETNTDSLAARSYLNLAIVKNESYKMSMRPQDIDMAIQYCEKTACISISEPHNHEHIRSLHIKAQAYFSKAAFINPKSNLYKCIDLCNHSLELLAASSEKELHHDILMTKAAAYIQLAQIRNTQANLCTAEHLLNELASASDLEEQPEAYGRFKTLQGDYYYVEALHKNSPISLLSSISAYENALHLSAPISFPLIRVQLLQKFAVAYIFQALLQQDTQYCDKASQLLCAAGEIESTHSSLLLYGYLTFTSVMLEVAKCEITGKFFNLDHTLQMLAMAKPFLDNKHLPFLQIKIHLLIAELNLKLYSMNGDDSFHRNCSERLHSALSLSPVSELPIHNAQAHILFGKLLLESSRYNDNPDHRKLAVHSLEAALQIFTVQKYPLKHQQILDFMEVI